MSELNGFESAERTAELPALLRFFRQRVDPHVRDLGSYTRLPSRLGRRVTQEELAEAIGVTREWYALLECGAASSRASIGLLNRLADALMLAPPEQAVLFRLALPELRRMQLRDDSVAALEAFSRLRSFTQRLWAATSVEDILTMTSEHIADWFDEAVLVSSSRRHESGPWELSVVEGNRYRNNVSTVIRESRSLGFTSEELDGLNLYPQLTNAGDLGTPDLHPTRIRRDLLNLYGRLRIAPHAVLASRVRSRTGLIATLGAWHEFGYSYSATDLAIVTAFAELASLALS